MTNAVSLSNSSAEFIKTLGTKNKKKLSNNADITQLLGNDNQNQNLNEKISFAQQIGKYRQAQSNHATLNAQQFSAQRFDYQAFKGQVSSNDNGDILSQITDFLSSILQNAQSQGLGNLLNLDDKSPQDKSNNESDNDTNKNNKIDLLAQLQKAFQAGEGKFSFHFEQLTKLSQENTDLSQDNPQITEYLQKISIDFTIEFKNSSNQDGDGQDQETNSDNANESQDATGLLDKDGNLDLQKLAEFLNQELTKFADILGYSENAKKKLAAGKKIDDNTDKPTALDQAIEAAKNEQLSKSRLGYFSYRSESLINITI